MRSFDLVDFKVLEAHYFLEKMEGFVVFPEINYLFSAFVSANRSITFCLQAVLKSLEGFESWYATQQKDLKSDPSLWGEWDVVWAQIWAQFVPRPTPLPRLRSDLRSNSC